MDKARRRHSFGRLAVLAIVAGGHVLLVMLFASSRPAETRVSSSSSEDSDPLVLLNLVPEAESSPTVDVPSLEPVLASAGVSVRLASEVGSAEVERPPPADVTIDWDREAQQTAQAMAPGLVRRQLKECEEAKKHGKYPPGCKKPASEYEPNWEPEEKRAGLLPLPYVRVGKRCIVALGFFNCTLGKLPEADGSVFENMYDTNRPESSVPDVPASVWPERPAPLGTRER